MIKEREYSIYDIMVQSAPYAIDIEVATNDKNKEIMNVSILGETDFNIQAMDMHGQFDNNDIGKECYFYDPITVTMKKGKPVGTVSRVDTNRVYVKFNRTRFHNQKENI